MSEAQGDCWGTLHHDLLMAIVQGFTRQDLGLVRKVNHRWRDVVDTTVTGVRVSSRAVQSMGSIFNVRKVVVGRFLNLQRLDLSGIPNHYVTFFADLSNLTKLDLKGQQIVDSGLESLTGLTRLTYLNLWDTRVERFSSKFIGSMGNLICLDLAGTLVGDDGVRNISRLKNLKSLNLWSTGVSDCGLKHVGKMKEITTLDLTSTWISDRGLMHLVGMSNLTSLDLSCTCVGNRSVRHSSTALVNLTFLGLRDTKVTFRCLEDLAALTGLVTLDIMNTQIGNDYAIFPESFSQYFSSIESLVDIVF